MDESPTSRRGKGWAYWCVQVLISVALYSGVYLGLGERKAALVSSSPGRAIRVYEPYYSDSPIVNNCLAWFFLPAHKLDRSLRPDHWVEVEYAPKRTPPRPGGVAGPGVK